MTKQQQADAAQERMARTRRVLSEAQFESTRIERALQRSTRIRNRALPVLRRAGYIK